MRYVFRIDNEYLKWVQWTAGVIPHFRTDTFEKAMIVDDEYLDHEVEKTNKTRRQLITEKYKNIEIVGVQITINV